MNDSINENTIAEALLNSAALKIDREPKKITIERAGFSFRVTGVDEDQVLKCRKLATKNKGRRDEETDWSRYSAYLIYNATTPEDCKTLWDNREVWQALNCVTDADVVFKCLTPAERAKIVSVIENLSGYDDTNLDDMIQNL